MTFALPNGFVRIHSPPRRARREAYISRDGAYCEYPLTPQQQWLHDRSAERYCARPDAYNPSPAVLSGEVGRYEGIRFIERERVSG